MADVLGFWKRFGRDFGFIRRDEDGTFIELSVQRRLLVFVILVPTATVVTAGVTVLLRDDRTFMDMVRRGLVIFSALEVFHLFVIPWLRRLFWEEEEV